ncbi:hypothetical protein [Methylomonas sp. TEB]|uniref:hypothetical protein n=1 Tax=Methylomonas sp. TEB TaxID=3398229 RepID=UPI0039F55FB3
MEFAHLGRSAPENRPKTASGESKALQTGAKRLKLDVRADFNSKKSRTSWVRGNIGGFFTSLLSVTVISGESINLQEFESECRKIKLPLDNIQELAEQLAENQPAMQKLAAIMGN